MYGWRMRMGHIYPSGGITGEQELAKMAPEGVAIHTTRVKFSRATYEQDLRMGDYVEDAALLLADARVDIIAFNCTMASLIKGHGYDKELIARMTEITRIPATTSTTAVLAALERLQVRKLVLVTPYLDQMNEIEAAFLEAQGYQVLAKRGLGIQDPFDQGSVSPAAWYRLVKELRDPAADLYFISCAGIEVVEIIDALEADLQKPVITSNQALLWDCLHRTGVGQQMQGFGTLVSDHLP